MQYQPPYGPNWPAVPDPNAPYVNASPPDGIKGSVPPASAFEYPMRELVNLISFGGYIPSDNDLAQATRGVRRAAFSFAMDTGSQNALSIGLFPPIIAYEQGTELRVLVANDNTGQSTIRVDGLTTQQIIRRDGTPLLAGDLRRGGVAVLVYDGTNFQLVSGQSSSVNISSGWFNGADWIVDIGSVNVLAGTPPIAPSAYAAGQGFSVYVKNTNTGPCTLNVNSLGAKPIKLPLAYDLQPGDIVPNQTIRVIYDGTNFIMTSPINRERIEAAVTFIVGPQAGADFPDLITAMKYLNRRRIGMSGAVTLSLQGATSGNALVHSYTSTVVITHPDGSRLGIVGPTLANSVRADSFTSVYPPNAGNIANDTISNLNMMRAAFRCELNFAAGCSLIFLGYLGILRNVLVTGAGLGATPAGNGVFVTGGWINVDTVASSNCNGACWYIDDNSTVDGRNFYADGSTSMAVGIAHGGALVIGDGVRSFPPGGPTVSSPGWCYIGQSYVDGIQMTFDGCVQITSTGAGGSGARIMGCGQRLVDHWGDSSFFMGARAVLMAHAGWQGVCTVSATAWCGGINCSSCNQGFLVSTNGVIDCDTCYTAGIAAGDYVATHGSFMYAAGFQNGGAQFSPARNVVGNANAYIEA
jgi:hypothetical protein